MYGTAAILSNSIREALCFEITVMLTAVWKLNLLCYFVQFPARFYAQRCVCAECGVKMWFCCRLDNVQPNPEFRYRWKNETCAAPTRLTGYKTLPLSVSVTLSLACALWLWCLNKLQFIIHSVNGDGSKTAKIIKKVILPTITLPLCKIWLKSMQ